MSSSVVAREYRSFFRLLSLSPSQASELSLSHPYNRHVAKTGEIKDFVITEESGIAKGIRRIIAVTGDGAAAVTKTADEAADKLASIEKLSDHSAKDSALKAFGTELARLDMSVVRKAALNNQFAKIRKALDTELKARDKADTKLVTDAITEYFAANPNATYLVRHFSIGINMKAVQAGIQTARKASKAVYLFSDDGSKSVHVNFVPKQDLDRGLNAKQWAEVVTKLVGGKGGGRDDGAQGVGEQAGQPLQDAIKAADEFYRSKCP